MARHKKGHSRSDRRRATLARAGLIPAGDPQGRSSSIAGVIVRRGKSLEVEPLFQSGPALPVERAPVKPQPGRSGAVHLLVWLQSPDHRTLGKSHILTDVMDALLADHLVQRGFSPKVLSEAAAAAELHERLDSYRSDLRRLFTFTVDPVMAKDFDDALSFERTPEGTTLVYVHIADVSYFVTEETALDREALRRGNSVYVATGVEPMLPPVLSSSVCSLLPGRRPQDRHGGDGGRRHAAGCCRPGSTDRSSAATGASTTNSSNGCCGARRPSTTNSRRRWNGGGSLAQRLRDMRYERGSLRIESAEPEFEWDENGQVISADPSEELESHWFIEVFMVLANEQVASFLEREHVSTVYRVHDLPDPFRVDHLLDILTSLGLPTPPFDPMQATPQDVRRVTRETAEWVDRYTPPGRGKAALVQQVLRAQSRAVYQTTNIGHFGLASEAYCHFTSPIRRYPDILVHRGLLAQLGLGPSPATSILSDWAEHCSRTEREAAKVELKADDIVLAHLLKRRLDEDGWMESVFEGQIVSLTRRGMFVLFDRLFQGYLSIDELPRDNYRLNELETAMEGKRSGRAYKIADLLQVRVTAVDEARGRVDLCLADGSGENGYRQRGRRTLARSSRRG